MSSVTLDTRIILRNDTLAAWDAKNPVLLKGEVAIISDTNKIRFGNGVDNFKTLVDSGLALKDIPLATASINGLMSIGDFVKLTGIATGAQVNTIEVIKVNGVATTIASGKVVDVIVPTKLSDLTNDTSFVSKTYVDAEINKKVDKITGKSLVSDSEIAKLANITANATKVEDSTTNGNIKINGTETNVYTHPDKHSATIITEDATHRFVTDVEKAAYAAKADTKADVGLGNVTNDAQVKRSEMGTANGVSTLDASGKVKMTEVPNLDASKITSGTISIDRLPQGALERLVPVTNQVARFALTTTDVQLGDTVKQMDNGIMYYVKDTANLNNESGYETYGSGTASSVPWGGVTNKPSSFPPSAHVHNKADISDFPTSMPANGGNADTVGGLTVKTAVPVGAVFTDTVYTHPSTHPYSMITGTPSKLPADGGNSATVNGLTVKTAVPENAVFTDTVYKHPSTHPASMITGLPTSLPASGGNADTVNGKTVLSNVPANAVFTDTVYTHPNTHPYSMITGTPTSLPANGGNAATVNGKTVLSNVPADAKFTDTIYTLPSTVLHSTDVFILNGGNA